MIIVAKGQLRHHFWGDYKATIGLKFHDQVLAAHALPQFQGFTQSDAVLVWFGGGDDFARVKALLVSMGADEDKIDSCATSIDYGEPFTVDVDLTPVDTAVQPSLLACPDCGGAGYVDVLYNNNPDREGRDACPRCQ